MARNVQLWGTGGQRSSHPTKPGPAYRNFVDQDQIDQCVTTKLNRQTSQVNISQSALCRVVRYVLNAYTAYILRFQFNLRRMKRVHIIDIIATAAAPTVPTPC